jgi:hypothetical protein
MEDAMDIDICPPWWPKIIWDLHFFPRPKPEPPNPVNYPPAIDDIMASLTMHTMSCLWLDQEAAVQVRDLAQKKMIDTVQNLSRLHDESISKRG